MGEFSVTHILLVLGIVLIFFGPSRLPSLGASMGKAIRGFKDAMKGGEAEPGHTAADSRPDLRSGPPADPREVRPFGRENLDRLQAPVTDAEFQTARDGSRDSAKDKIKTDPQG